MDDSNNDNTNNSSGSNNKNSNNDRKRDYSRVSNSEDTGESSPMDHPSSSSDPKSGDSSDSAGPASSYTTPSSAAATRPPPKSRKKSSSSSNNNNKKASSSNPSHKKPKGMPRRPQSAYNLFFQEERLKCLNQPQNSHENNNHRRTRRRESGDMVTEARQGSNPTMEQEIAARWKVLPNDARDEYEAKARKDLVRYEQEMEEYNMIRLQPTISWGRGAAGQDAGVGGEGPYSSLSDGSSSPPLSDGGGANGNHHNNSNKTNDSNSNDSPTRQQALHALAVLLKQQQEGGNSHALSASHQEALSMLFMSMLSQDQISELRRLLQQLDNVLGAMSHLQAIHTTANELSTTNAATGGGAVRGSPKASSNKNTTNNTSQNNRQPQLDVSALMGFLRQLQSQQSTNDSS